MKVIIKIRDGDKVYNFDELNEAQKSDMRHSLNRQTADALGYVEEKKQ